MRFEVPQFIEVEDRVVGPFTWKQFVYLAGGAGLLFILNRTLPFLFFVLLGLPVGALTGFLAFHQVNNRPFSFFLESLITYVRKRKLYLWRREHEQVIIERSEKKKRDHTFANSVSIAEKKTLSSLSQRLHLDTHNS